MVIITGIFKSEKSCLDAFISVTIKSISFLISIDDKSTLEPFISVTSIDKALTSIVTDELSTLELLISVTVASTLPATLSVDKSTLDDLVSVVVIVKFADIDNDEISILFDFTSVTAKIYRYRLLLALTRMIPLLSHQYFVRKSMSYHLSRPLSVSPRKPTIWSYC